MEFVDTSAWFACFMPNDPNHDQLRKCLQLSNQPLVTTDYCIDETLTLLMARGELRHAFEAGRAFFEENVALIHFVTAEQIHRAWILLQQWAAAGWSFTDCTSRIVIQELDIKRALAMDAHFGQFGIVVTP